MSTYTSDLVRNHIRALNPQVIVECGTCNGEDTLDLLKTYRPNQIFTFEANPENHPWCREKLAGEPQITLVEQAVSDKTGTVTFYPGDIKHCRFPNGGISSMYPFRPGHPEFQLQAPITVPSTRLDDFLRLQGIEQVELVCLDVQGAELLALRGLGNYLHTVKAIISEVWFNPYYDGAPVYGDLINFLKPYGFTTRELFRFENFGDALWLKS